MGCREIAPNTYLTVGHSPYCPLSAPVQERGTPKGIPSDELPIECTCCEEGD